MIQEDIENLVLEGGSVKAWAHIGALLQLEEHGILQKIKRFAGTSAGSLFAALLAANFTATEIAKVGKTLDFSELAHNNIISGTYSIFRYEGYGIHSSDRLKKQIQDILATHNISSNITLKELYTLTNKELVIVTTNLNREKAVYFHHAQYPDVKLVDAMICSIGIPVLLRAQVKNYILSTEDYYVDGGLVDNYPLFVYNNLEALYTGTLYSVEKDRISPRTIGLKLLTPGQTNSYDVVTQRKEIGSFEQYLLQLLNTMMSQIDRLLISPSYIAQTIPISVGNISFLKFDITEKEMNELVQAGRDSVVKYFALHV